MMGDAFFVFFVFLTLAGVIYFYQQQEKRKAAVMAAIPPETRAELTATNDHGPKNPMMICPHCQTKGEIRTRSVVMKKGVSGGKAAAAVMTAGISTLAVGLSRKENLTSAWCGACNNSWIF